MHGNCSSAPAVSSRRDERGNRVAAGVEHVPPCQLALVGQGTGHPQARTTTDARGNPITTSHTGPVEVIIIAAMDSEIAPFLERATDVDAAAKHGNAVHRTGTLDGRTVLFVRGGIGLVNAAAATTSALLLAGTGSPGAPLPLVVSAGSAGGLGDSVRVGDVVVSMDTLNADADARALGYELGQVPGMPASYPVPQHLADAAARGLPAQRRAETVHHGLTVSSYAFVGPDRAGVIKEQFPGVLATDMESSAIAQVCHAHGAPFLAIRGISDMCGPASNEFIQHVDDAAERSAEIAVAVVDAWLTEASGPAA